VALIDGAAGERQYSDQAVRNPQVIAVRDKVNAIVDPAIKPEQVDMTITLKDGRTLHKYVGHAIGSLEVPMTDRQLEAKFLDLADGILPAARARKLMELCWQVEGLPAAAAIAKAGVR
jgi:2-methylcitrate dehydratase PrpD